jgi:hypothetical protein
VRRLAAGGVVAFALTNGFNVTETAAADDRPAVHRRERQHGTDDDGSPPPFCIPMEKHCSHVPLVDC